MNNSLLFGIPPGEILNISKALLWRTCLQSLPSLHPRTCKEPGASLNGAGHRYANELDAGKTAQVISEAERSLNGGEAGVVRLSEA